VYWFLPQQELVLSKVISPDESYLVLPRGDYLVSFRDEHDRWTDLQEITLRHPAQDRTDFFWVETRIIEELKPNELR